MAKRTKILIVCDDTKTKKEKYLKWHGLLTEALGKKAKDFPAEDRIETPYAIIDFVFQKPLYTGRYQTVLDVRKDLYTKKQNEELLRLATGGIH